MTRFSETYPPRNRIAEPTHHLEIHLVHAGGTHRLDPNTILAISFGAGPFEFADLVPLPDRKSLISGEPAIVYRYDDVEVALTPQETDLLVSHSLPADAYFQLRDELGVFYEIHEDFYDEASGHALHGREPIDPPRP